MADDQKPDGTPQSWQWGQNTDRFFFTHEISSGMTDHEIAKIAAGHLADDIHIDKIAFSLEAAPGAGKTVTVAVSDGTTTMTVNVTEAAIEGSSTTNNFDLDVSGKVLTVQCTTSGGTATGALTVLVIFHKITI